MQAPTTHDEIIEHRGGRVRIRGSAWWLDCAAVADADGKRVEVARIHYESTDMRYPSQEQLDANPGMNRYWLDPSNSGRLAAGMIGFDDAELVKYGIVPGKLAFPNVVPGARPSTNVTSNPVSLRRQQQAMDWLQNDCIGKPSDY